jgi:arabinose-5-phosphate isomerase
MHKGQEVPQVGEAVLASVAILEMSAKKLGMTTVVDRAGGLIGVITDGDLRRFVQQGGDFSKITAGALASRRPKLIGPDELAAKAVKMMERYSITTLVVADNTKRIAGIVHLHDLLKHGIV